MTEKAKAHGLIIKYEDKTKGKFIKVLTECQRQFKTMGFQFVLKTGDVMPLNKRQRNQALQIRHTATAELSTIL